MNIFAGNCDVKSGGKNWYEMKEESCLSFIKLVSISEIYAKNITERQKKYW